MPSSHHHDEDRPLIGALLRGPANAVVRTIDEGLRQAGVADLRPEYFNVFINVDHDAGSRITELARLGHVTKQTMGHLVGYLESHGYVRTATDPADGRAKRVHLTRKGWKVHDTAIRIVEDLEKEWAARIGPARFDRLVALLTQLGAEVDAHGHEHSRG